MQDFFSVVTLNDIVYSFAAACILTFVIKRIRFSYGFMGIYRDVRIDYDPVNIRAVVQSCCELFPVETVSFRGNTYARGSIIEILTRGNSRITGELIGANDDDMICLITKKQIIARELSEIMSITVLNAAAGTETHNGRRSDKL